MSATSRRLPDHPPLRRADLSGDPIDQFRIWFDAWRADAGETPEAVVLSTADGDGRPSSRYVLLRAFDDRGFVYFTNYNSRKGRDLADNPFASLCFGWLEHRRQVRVSGPTEMVSEDENDAYWATRPRGSQIAGAVSDQSEPIDDRGTLEARFAALEARHAIDDGPIPRPAHWGGARVIPMEVEFWQGQEHRMHDRFAYRRRSSEGSWTITRLMP